MAIALIVDDKDRLEQNVVAGDLAGNGKLADA